eukprot:NODE_10249_length_312_cov_379.898833.p3 GENE.NODE_10249_length_312_cov_379.898833~~NODE_10249_length_312_cov_379.898833.p3  ORF type:complete len:50 (-),score=8.40 NODE_10249_length_312_cov_379.898833:82-231(-)
MMRCRCYEVRMLSGSACTARRVLAALLDSFVDRSHYAEMLADAFTVAGN